VSAAVTGVAAGAGAGAGVLLVVRSWASSRRPSLESRVLPYVRDVPAVARAWRREARSDAASTALVAITEPLRRRAGDILGRVLGGAELVRRRLERAGDDSTAERFRLSQASYGMAAGGAVLVLGMLGPARHHGTAVGWLLLSAGAALAGLVARDLALSRRIARRDRQILAEFPVVADLIALAVAAGEGPIGAIARVVSTCTGALADDLSRVLAESRTGVPIAGALDGFARRSTLPIVSRFADGVVVALERGTPLVDVLVAQAADVRDSAQRALVESGARREIAMMVPVVFLILPITLLFAFFPGVVGLNLIAS
jgi:tight adherence protein C